MEKYQTVNKERAILVGAILQRDKVNDNLAELKALGAFPDNNATINFEAMVQMFIAGKAAGISLPSDQLGKIVVGKQIRITYEGQTAMADIAHICPAFVDTCQEIGPGFSRRHCI